MSAQPVDDSLQQVLDAGQLVPGLDVEFPPRGFIDESGEIVVDIIRKRLFSRRGAFFCPQPAAHPLHGPR